MMHEKKKVSYLLSPAERKVEGHLEDRGECPYCCFHLSAEKLAGAKERARVMGYTRCDQEVKVK